MKIAFFDCFAGASGDMILGALLDAGLELAALKSQLGGLKLTHFDLQVEKVVKKGVGGSQALVLIDQDHHSRQARHLSDIRTIIDKSDLPEPVRRRSMRIFTRLAEAEARVHRTAVERIHFHEVGAVDAIVDVVGSVAGLYLLNIDAIYCSPLHVGSGTVTCAHGTLPVPAPATAELTRNVPVYSTGVKGELLTPTGAAILTTLATGFGPMPAMTVSAWGYGAGTSDPALPNLLRMAVGQTDTDVHGYDMEQAAVVETNIDDMNPQLYDYMIQALLDLGVMDVFLTRVQMKKNRPGTLVTVICKPQMVGSVSELLMRETTTIGLRWRTDNRIKAKRAFAKVQTPFGDVQIKIARAGERVVNIGPEYEDCRRLALEKRVPLKEVMDAARAAITEADIK